MLFRAGAANIQDGVAINLSLMRAVSVNDEQTITRVGPGARWSDVYSTLSPMNLSVVPGTNIRGFDFKVLGGHSIVIHITRLLSFLDQ